MSAEHAERAALLLVGARQEGYRLADLPEDLRPATVEQAYAIQDATNRHMGPVGGWKVGPRRGGNEPRCAPIPAALFQQSPAKFGPGQIPSPEAEVEIAVTLGSDLPPRSTPYTADDLRGAIATIHPAVEVLSSRFLDRKAVTPLTAIADGQSNAAVVLGKGLGDWAGLDLGKVAMRLRLDGMEVTAAAGGPGTDDMLAALAWLAGHVAMRGGGLKKGDVVITGARLGPWPIDSAEAEAEAVGLGSVRLAFLTTNGSGSTK